MANEEPKTVGADGIFKLLAWKTRAITRLLGLAEIGEPIDQEFQFPTQRRVDGLYRLRDGSILNVEHQSSLGGRDDLARRLVAYHIMIKQKFPKDRLSQVVVYTGKISAGIRKLDSIEYRSLDASGKRGLRFSAALINFRSTPVDEFRNSGLIDDLILGLRAQGGDDEIYIDDVIAGIKAMEGEARTSAIEKFAAVCATMPDRKVGRIDFGETNMWIDEVKDSPFVRSFIKIAGKEEIEAQRRGTLARLLTAHANKLRLNPPDNAESLLMAHANEETLFAMANDMENMKNFHDFVKSHGVEIEGSKC